MRFKYEIPMIAEKQCYPYTPIERVACKVQDGEGEFTIDSTTWHRGEKSYHNNYVLDRRVKQLRRKLKAAKMKWREEVQLKLVEVKKHQWDTRPVKKRMKFVVFTPLEA